MQLALVAFVILSALGRPLALLPVGSVRLPRAGFLLSLVLRGRGDGVLVPIPQYPLYSASLALQESHMLGYELVEESSWALPVPELEKKLTEAKANGVETRALVVINPGNPTGNTLSDANMKDIVTFCTKHDLVLMADEVYQASPWQCRRR